MAFTDDVDMDMEESGEEGPPPEEGNNRTFLIVVIGGVILIVITLACMIGYLMTRGNQNRAQRLTQAAEVNAQNTEVALAISQTAVAQAWTPTPTKTSIPNTPTITSTPVVAMPTNTSTPLIQLSPTQDPRTATVAALLTSTPATPTSTALPSTGFAEDIRMMGLLVMAGVLVLVIFLARRLRASGAP